MPTVSLIIPVYNTEKWLRRCLDSVLAQVYTDYEVILVDDGSKDGSAAILDEYAERDSRFRIFHEKNRGSSLARQFGISKAKGEWLVFMDSDDDVHPMYIQALYDAAMQHNLKLAACDMQRVKNDAEPIEQHLKQPIVLDEITIHKRFFHYDFWAFWGGIYHKSLFGDIIFPEYNINEDYVVKAQLFHMHPCLAYVPNALYYYRSNPESQSHLKLTPRIMDEYYNKKWVLEFYEKNEPKYAGKARAQLMETVLKLYNIIRKEDKQNIYQDNSSQLKTVIANNLNFILFKSGFPLALRILSLKHVIWA